MDTRWLVKLLWIAVGGGAGSVLRYAIAGYGHRLTGGTFPLGTLIVNVAGCFLIGFLGAALTGPWLLREEHRTALLVGVLGGFTTFSTFGYETFSLANERQFLFAALNVLLSVALGLLAVWLGFRVAERWPGV